MGRMRTRWRLFLLLLTVGGVIVGGGWLWYRWTFPYGWSHSCDTQLMFALDKYARDHGGAYPSGGATPEASLSLLYPRYAEENVLQGKSVPLNLVKAILEGGDRLGPDTCGWHYVDGLRLDDDRRLAICWDKIGLGHNGQRLSDGGRTVLFVNLRYEYIEGSKWDDFLEEQNTLLVERKARKER